MHRNTFAQLLDKQTLERLYIVEGLLQREIAKKYDTSQRTISRLMQKYGIKKRPKTGEYNPMYGKKRPDLARRNRGNTGIPCSKQRRQSIISNAATNPNYGMRGKTMPEESVRDQSIRLLGKNNPNWNDGISFDPYNILFNPNFKQMVKEKYGHVCLHCGSNKRLTVHHINYIKAHSSFINCVLVCTSCNSKFNINRDYWFAYWCNFLKINPGYNLHEAEIISSMNISDLNLFISNGYKFRCFPTL